MSGPRTSCPPLPASSIATNHLGSPFGKPARRHLTGRFDVCQELSLGIQAFHHCSATMGAHSAVCFRCRGWEYGVGVGATYPISGHSPYCDRHGQNGSMVHARRPKDKHACIQPDLKRNKNSIAAQVIKLKGCLGNWPPVPRLGTLGLRFAGQRHGLSARRDMRGQKQPSALLEA